MMKRISSDTAVANFQITLQLALDALQGVVDRFDVAIQIHRDLLIGLSVQIQHKHFALQIAEDLGHLVLQAGKLFLVDDQFFRIAHLRAANDVEQRSVRFLIVDRLVQGNVRIQRNMLLPRCRLDRGNDLARNAQLRERFERSKLIPRKSRIDL